MQCQAEKADGSTCGAPERFPVSRDDPDRRGGPSTRPCGLRGDRRGRGTPPPDGLRAGARRALAGQPLTLSDAATALTGPALDKQ